MEYFFLMMYDQGETIWIFINVDIPHEKLEKSWKNWTRFICSVRIGDHEMHRWSADDNEKSIVKQCYRTESMMSRQ